MPWTAHDRPFLDPAVVARLGTLELKARTIVEGFLSGLHRSPFKGFSVEFAEYRQYIPGDDLHTIDWKVTRGATATTSRSSRKKPISTVICCSTSAARWATARTTA
jgi:hypothetical protein